MPLGRRHTTVGTGRVTPAEAAVSTVPPVTAARPRRPFPRAWSAARGGGVAGDPAIQLPHRPIGVILLPRVESKIAFAERFLANCPIAKDVTIGLD
jgi:hypothetical protein